LKTLNPYDKILSHVMTRRSDAQVFFTDDVDCKYLDAYLAEKAAQGIELSYMDIINAALVRIYALRPALNRFIVNSRVFANDEIKISMAVKKALREEATSTTIKLSFTGHENIFDVAEKFGAEIQKNKGKESENATDRLMRTVTNAPHLLIKIMVWLIKLADRWNILPKGILDASPFHGSVFITYLKSLGIRSIYHHIYDFGTIGLFIGLGKEKRVPVVDRETGEIRPGKLLELMVVADERLCDGLYHAKSMRMLRKLVENPRQLEERLEHVERDID
jgi:hypothetical protein